MVGCGNKEAPLEVARTMRRLMLESISRDPLDLVMRYMAASAVRPTSAEFATWCEIARKQLELAGVRPPKFQTR